jgi:hypothetical protein
LTRVIPLLIFQHTLDYRRTLVTPSASKEESLIVSPVNMKARHLSLAALIASAQLQAQNPAAPPQQPTPTSKVATATRIRGGSINIDGKLDEPLWQTAKPITDFVQKEPVEGGAPSDSMEVRFLYDDAALYVATRVITRAPRAIQAPVARRDNISQAEHIWISLDSYRDRRTAYSFGVTASGVRGDWYHPTDNETNTDLGFDPVWEAASHIEPTGWTAEMRIPFSQLRFNAAEVQHWGLNVDHWIPSKNEAVFWLPVPRKGTGWSSRMGSLEGISGIKPSRRLELIPYVASDATVNANRDRRNPFDDGRNLGGRAGGDLKMGLGPSLTLEATVNPDFGQVEADPAEVNLSAFETFFPEKRPFFIEGSQLLRGNGASYFYSRRIGARPRGPANGSFVDYPQASTILGAAKITGQLPNGASLGALTAVTAREKAETYDVASQQFSKTVVAPLTMYGVGRVQKQFGKDASTAGLSLTGMQRDLQSEEPLAQILNRRAYSGGYDLNWRFDGGAWSVRNYLGFSHIAGDSAAILLAQRSSARYFQRLDAKAYHVDSSRTGLTGGAGTVEIDKNTGNWLGYVYGGFESPAFETNDVGRLGTSDGRFGGFNARYRDTQPGKRLRNYSLGGGLDTEMNFDNDVQFRAPYVQADATLKNFWALSFFSSYFARAQDERLTRGGPSMGTGSFLYGILQLSNSSASKTRWSGRVYYGKDEYGAPVNRISGLFSIRPVPQWQLSFEPNYLRAVNSRQYVATLQNGRTETYGRRYVFAFIDQATFLTDIRLNYTIKPDMTLEFWAEPFAASGRYYDFGELLAPRSRQIRQYGEDGTTIVRQEDGRYLVTDPAVPGTGGAPTTFSLPFPDFNVRSVRSNFVVRWEYRPGSTMFFVWQQNRSGFEPNGDLVRVTDLFSGYKKRGTNFFAVKASFWIPAM